MKMNTTPDVIFDQIRHNLARGLKQLRPFQEQSEQKVIVLGGSPSLNDFVDEIKEHKKNGAKIVTINSREHNLATIADNSILTEPGGEGKVLETVREAGDLVVV